MTSRRYDSVDEALAQLRRDDVLERPDPSLERRLQRRFGRRRLRTGLRRAAMLLIVLGLSAAVVEATVGFELLRSWWYDIVIDGHQVRGVLRDGGERVYEYTTRDGCHVTVRVHRRSVGSGTETGIRVESRTDHGLETETEIETIEGGPPRVADRLERSALADATRLHDWIGADGHRLALFWRDEPTGGSLLVEELDSSSPRPVRIVGRTERGPGPDTRATIVENATGGLEIELADGDGWLYALGFAAPPSRGPGTELVTPDGRVRVRIEGERE